MADLDDFIADPKTFMETHIVQVTTPDPSTIPDDRPVRVTLASTPLKIHNSSGGKLFELYVTRDPAQQALDAYFCPYENDKSFFVTLGKGARYCFTPRMDGCSFGVGSQDGSGTVRVGHVNFVQQQTDWKDQGLDQARKRMYGAQDAFLRDRLGVAQDRIISPPGYRGPQFSDAATTFGVRGDDDFWTFYTLRYARPGDRTFLHLGVHQHVSGR